MFKLINEIVDGYEPSAFELTCILKLKEDEAEYLFNKAYEVKKNTSNNEIHLRAIIEFSNYCRCKCYYCGLCCQNQNLKRYRMTPDEIIENAIEANNAGYKTVVLQSGEDMYYTEDMISYIIKEIKKNCNMAITLSVGERSYEEYKKWRNDGADRFLMKHETSNEALYNMYHPHSSFKKRMECLRWLSDLGYQVGSGFMIGLPKTGEEDYAKDILLLKSLKVHMAGIGPFIPHKDTNLKEGKMGSAFLTMKAVALTRILIKDIQLPATTAFNVVSKSCCNQNSKLKNESSIKALACSGESEENNENVKKIFRSGANVLMKKVEPYKYRKLYEIYPRDEDKIKSISEERREVERLIYSMGFNISSRVDL
jgi:biotin synthase